MRNTLKYLILLVCTLFLHRQGEGQSYYIEEPKVFSGGLILGMNFTQIDGDTYFGYHKVGLNAGGVVYAHFTQIFGASMELTYSQKGSRGEAVLESPVAGTYVTKYFMNINYVEVPVTLHVVIRNVDVEAGASYGRLVSSKEWILADQQITIDPDKNAFSTTDIESVFGIGMKVYKHFHANIRFQYSLTSIRSPEHIPAGYGYGNEGQFNNLFCARIMYMF